MTALPNPFFAPAEGVVPTGETSPPLPTSPVGTSDCIHDLQFAYEGIDGGSQYRCKLCSYGVYVPLSEPAPTAPATSSPGVETPAVVTSPATADFSFQPDFEKLFNEIMGQQT